MPTSSFQQPPTNFIRMRSGKVQRSGTGKMAGNWQRAANGLRAGYRWFTGGQSSRVSRLFSIKKDRSTCVALFPSRCDIILTDAHHVDVSPLPHVVGGGFTGKGGKFVGVKAEEPELMLSSSRRGRQCFTERWRQLEWSLGTQ